MGRLKPLSEDLVGVDIDGKDADTVNALIYGQESSGITHAVKVDASGNISVNVTSDIKVATTPILYNITMTVADTEYSQLLPDDTKKVEFRCRDIGFSTRYAYETGKVATPTVPYGILAPGETKTVEGLNLTTKTLYFACGTGTKVMQIEVWT